MKITNIELLGNHQTIRISYEGTLNQNNLKVWIDDFFNYNNLESTENEAHSTTITDCVVANNTITIEAPGELHGLFYVTTTDTTNKDTAALYNDDNIYYRKVQLVTNNCDSCLSQAKMDAICALMFREQLFYKAMELNKLADVDKHYREMLRILKVDNCLDYAFPYTREYNCFEGICMI